MTRCGEHPTNVPPSILAPAMFHPQNPYALLPKLTAQWWRPDRLSAQRAARLARYGGVCPKSHHADGFVKSCALGIIFAPNGTWLRERWQ